MVHPGTVSQNIGLKNLGSCKRPFFGMVLMKFNQLDGYASGPPFKIKLNSETRMVIMVGKMDFTVFGVMPSFVLEF